jgi:hypothetical protein
MASRINTLDEVLILVKFSLIYYKFSTDLYKYKIAAGTIEYMSLYLSNGDCSINK